MGRKNTSGYIGVTWGAVAKQWCAQITNKGEVIPIGRFKDKIEAARAFDKAARKLRGPNAKVNFPEEK